MENFRNRPRFTNEQQCEKNEHNKHKSVSSGVGKISTASRA